MAGITLNRAGDTLTLRLNRTGLQAYAAAVEILGWRRNPECIWEFTASFGTEILEKTVYGRNPLLPLAIDSPWVRQRYGQAKLEEAGQ